MHQTSQVLRGGLGVQSAKGRRIKSVGRGRYTSRGREGIYTVRRRKGWRCMEEKVISNRKTNLKSEKKNDKG